MYNFPHDYLLKFVILGDSKVGKSNLLARFVDDSFKKINPTIGVEFGAKIIPVAGKQVKLQIWDVGGQAPQNISRSYLRGANALLVVFDVTNPTSFSNAQELCNENKAKFKVMLVGTKSDLTDERRVSSQEAEQYAQANGFQYIETSAKKGTNVSQPFEKLAQEIVQGLEKTPATDNADLEKFKKAYLEQYRSEFFKNPWSEMKLKIESGAVNLDIVRQHAKDAPDSRTDKVLKALKI